MEHDTPAEITRLDGFTPCANFDQVAWDRECEEQDWQDAALERAIENRHERDRDRWETGLQRDGLW